MFCAAGKRHISGSRPAPGGNVLPRGPWTRQDRTNRQAMTE